MHNPMHTMHNDMHHMHDAMHNMYINMHLHMHYNIGRLSAKPRLGQARVWRMHGVPSRDGSSTPIGRAASSARSCWRCLFSGSVTQLRWRPPPSWAQRAASRALLDFREHVQRGAEPSAKLNGGSCNNVLTLLRQDRRQISALSTR